MAGDVIEQILERLGPRYRLQPAPVAFEPEPSISCAATTVHGHGHPLRVGVRSSAFRR